MGFSLEISVPVLTVFLQGLLSFFSPCVLPLLPLYIGYLSGGTGTRGSDGRMYYHRRKVMVNTLFFVVGVSFAFFTLGLGVSALGSFLNSRQMLFARIGGILIIWFGLYQLGIFGHSGVLGKEHRIPFDLGKFAMSPWVAFLMGFTFSFAWTPCVGPALASVLLMAASSATRSMGLILIGVYTLGFVLPFLAVGMFTSSLLDFFRKHVRMVQYTIRIGGVLMILMGILMFTGKMNAVTGYLSDLSVSTKAESEEAYSESSASLPAETETVEAETQSEEEKTEETVIPAPDFTLTDQYGNTHTLSDYQGKTVFLNFWATWCPPCRNEMPDIQKLYETYDQEGDDALVVLGVAAPGQGGEKSAEEIAAFLEENGYTYPVVMDESGTLFYQYGITSFPTTFMIDREGNVFGYVSGQLSEDIMISIVEQTMEGRRNS